MQYNNKKVEIKAKRHNDKYTIHYGQLQAKVLLHTFLAY